MKNSSSCLLAGAGGLLVAAGSSHATFIGIKFVQKRNPYALTYNLYATFDTSPPGEDFVFAVAGTPLNPLNINVCKGTFYQNQFGSDKAPNSLLFQLFPSLEFDTFVTIGKKTASGDATGLAPGWPGFGPDRLVMNNSGWFITPDDPQGSPDANGQVLLAQLSTQNGIGFFGTILVSGFSDGISFQQVLSFQAACDHLPAPATPALLGLAGLAGTARRRRTTLESGPCRSSITRRCRW